MISAVKRKIRFNFTAMPVVSTFLHLHLYIKGVNFKCFSYACSAFMLSMLKKHTDDEKNRRKILQNFWLFIAAAPPPAAKTLKNEGEIQCL